MVDLKIGCKYLDRTSPLVGVEVTYWDYAPALGALVIDLFGNAYRVDPQYLEELAG